MVHIINTCSLYKLLFMCRDILTCKVGHAVRQREELVVTEAQFLQLCEAADTGG